MQIAQLLLEYFKVLTWPVVLVILLIAYRQKVSKIFPRLSGVETPGFSATFDHSSDEAAAVGSSAQHSPTMPTLDNMVKLKPTNYISARNLGNRLRAGNPVLMDLTELDEADAKRLVDFSAGAAYLSSGSIDKVSNRVFIVTPGRDWVPKPPFRSDVHEDGSTR